MGIKHSPNGYDISSDVLGTLRPTPPLEAVETIELIRGGAICNTIYNFEDAKLCVERETKKNLV
jgi:hypothetical protein